MSEADKLFIKLGYSKEKIGNDVCFTKFWEETKCHEDIYFDDSEESVDIGYDKVIGTSLDFATINAIYLKTKELGW